MYICDPQVLFIFCYRKLVFGLYLLCADLCFVLICVICCITLVYTEARPSPKRSPARWDFMSPPQLPSPPSPMGADPSDPRRATMPENQNRDPSPHSPRLRTTSVPPPTTRVRPSGPRTRSSSTAMIHIPPPSSFSRYSQDV